MLQEELWEIWNGLLQSRQVQLPSDVDAYLRGEQNQVSGPVSKKQKYYLNYPDKLVKELDGENAELARRMLYVISLVRSVGPVGSYDWNTEVPVCARIGYTFHQILQVTFFHHQQRFSGKQAYSLASMMVDLFPAESEAYADEMLESETDLSNLIRKRKSDNCIYLMMDIGCCLFLKDKERYGRFLPALEKCAGSMGNDTAIVMLYQARNSSDALRQRLRELLSQNISAANDLYRQCVSDGSMRETLRELELPSSIYYTLLALKNIWSEDRHRQFRKLYEEDKETLFETWRVVSKNQSPEAVSSLGLLAIMLQNGCGEEQLKEQMQYILNYADQFAKPILAGGQKFLHYLEKDPLTLSDVDELVYWDQMNFNYGYLQETMEFYATIYTWVPAARNLYFLLLHAARRHKDLINMTRGMSHFSGSRVKWLGVTEKENAALLLDMGFCRADLVRAYAINIADCSYWPLHGISEEFGVFAAKGHEAEILEDFYHGEPWTPGQTVALLKLLYNVCGLEDCVPLLELLSSKSKPVRDLCEAFLSDREDAARALLEKRLSSYKGDGAQSAKKIMKRWDNERKFGKDFLFTENAVVEEFCKDNYDSTAGKKLSWIPEDLLAGVRYKDLSGEAPAIVMQYILSEYASLTTPYRLKACDKVADRLNPQDLQNMLENLFQRWMESGADAKQKSILLPYCIYGSDPQLIRMRRQMEDWAQASRGALAAYTVNGLALNGSSMVLMMVDAMGTKFPNNQVKKAARAAFAFAAKALEIPEDELADRIVPNMGFSKAGEKTLDYGSRTFTVSLLPDFSLSITDDEKGKAVKSLPKPGVSDDAVKAEASKKEFSELKKQIKAVIQTQSARLERVLMDGRWWSAQRWEALFVENAVMHHFATGLIWGIYEGNKLLETFRYMEDGTFNTVEEEEYTLPENASIALVHPLELEADCLEAWKQQLEDYEVVQPIPQLTQPRLTIQSGDLDGKVLTRYQNKSVKAGRLSAMSKKYNLYRGDVLDGGSYTCFHLWDKYLGVGVQFNFEYMFMGQDFDETVPLEKVIFYRLSEDQEQPDDDIKEHMILDPAQVLPRFVSTVLAMMEGLVQ